MNPNFADLVVKLVALQVLPTLEPFPLRPQSLAGFAHGRTQERLEAGRFECFRQIHPNRQTVIDDEHCVRHVVRLPLLARTCITS